MVATRITTLPSQASWMRTQCSPAARASITPNCFRPLSFVWVHAAQTGEYRFLDRRRTNVGSRQHAAFRRIGWNGGRSREWKPSPVVLGARRFLLNGYGQYVDSLHWYTCRRERPFRSREPNEVLRVRWSNVLRQHRRRGDLHFYERERLASSRHFCPVQSSARIRRRHLARGREHDDRVRGLAFDQ